MISEFHEFSAEREADDETGWIGNEQLEQPLFARARVEISRQVA